MLTAPFIYGLEKTITAVNIKGNFVQFILARFLKLVKVEGHQSILS